MARRRKAEPGKFRLSHMRDVLTETCEKLYDGIRKQNPNCDIDDLENDLRDLVKKHGVASSPSRQESTASSKPSYNVAGDFLVTAYEKIREGQTRDGLIAFISACGAEGCESLMNAITAMNAEIMDDLEENDENDMDDPFAPEPMMAADDEDNMDETDEDTSLEVDEETDNDEDIDYENEDDGIEDEEEEPINESLAKLQAKLLKTR